MRAVENPTDQLLARLRDLEEQLLRIGGQNAEILALLGDKTESRKQYSVDQVADRVARRPWTIRQLCSKGLIRGVKGEDGKWRISSDELARLEANGVPKLPN